jgi:hypothetical protein
MSIAIANPIQGQATHTSHNRAQYLINTGQAEMIDGKLLITKQLGNKVNWLSAESYSIKIVNTKLTRLPDAPRMPVTQWLHS